MVRQGEDCEHPNNHCSLHLSCKCLKGVGAGLKGAQRASCLNRELREQEVLQRVKDTRKVQSCCLTQTQRGAPPDDVSSEGGELSPQRNGGEESGRIRDTCWYSLTPFSSRLEQDTQI